MKPALSLSAEAGRLLDELNGGSSLTVYGELTLTTQSRRGRTRPTPQFWSLRIRNLARFLSSWGGR